MPQISVIVLTYNPDNRKLRQTLSAIAAQKDVDMEVLISDDGSARKDFSFLPEYMAALGITNYRLLAHEVNRGTVGSCLAAVREAAGKYVFLTSPGDYLYDDTVLQDFYNFAEENACPICFGNAVFYCAQDGLPVLTKTVGAPARPQLYAPNAKPSTVKRHFFGGDWIIGASYFRKRNVFLEALEQIESVSKYTEDTPTTAFSLAAGHKLCYFDRNTVWYEDGTGVSTGASEKWAKLLREDAVCSFTKLKNHYPKDPYVDITFRNLTVTNRIQRIFGKLLRHPLLCLQIAVSKGATPKTIVCPQSDLRRLAQLLKIT